MAHPTPRLTCHEMKPLVAKTSQLLHQQAMVVGAVETKRKEIGLMRNRVRRGVNKKKRKRKKTIIRGNRVQWPFPNAKPSNPR
jgi:hypothetical protein